jgi:TolB protein
VTVDATTFVDAKVLVQSAGENNYYPSYSPDGNWLAFNRSSHTDSYDQPDARVYMINAQGGSPIALTTASPSGGDSWPKWSPQVHTFYSGQMYWLTFSSRRPYGLHAGSNAQIWMVGIDPARAAAGMDASFAAFWLPFQDFTQGNHIAQWAETVVRPPCDPGCPTGEYCDNGECFPNPQ